MFAIRHLGFLAVVCQVVLYTRISTVHKYAFGEFVDHIRIQKHSGLKKEKFRSRIFFLRRQGAGMKVICAGFPKTGTKSMAMALRYVVKVKGTLSSQS